MPAQTSTQQNYTFQWIALLGLLTALGPLSIDMYLPALPEMAQDFGTTTQSISSSVPAYFLGLAIGQLIYGTLSDRIGRKTPLYIGLSIYIVASLLCAFAMSENTLIAARVLQALGGCVGVVIARAAIRDCFDTVTSVQALAHMTLILGLAPILAPIVGALLLQFFNWHFIFVLLASIGLITLVFVHLTFKETLPEERRLHLTLKQIFILYGNILKDSSFRTPMLAMSFFSGLLFCYLTSSSALMIESLGFNQKTFALVFGVNAFGIMVFSFINSRLVKKVGLLPLLQFGGSLQLMGAVLLGLMAYLPEPNLPVVLLGMFLVVSAIGFTGPNATALALSGQRERAGAASALLGSMQFGFGLMAGVILYHLDWTTLTNMSVVMLGYAVMGLFCVYILRIRAKRAMKKA